MREKKKKKYWVTLTGGKKLDQIFVQKTTLGELKQASSGFYQLT